MSHPVSLTKDSADSVWRVCCSAGESESMVCLILTVSLWLSSLTCFSKQNNVTSKKNTHWNHVKTKYRTISNHVIKQTNRHTFEISVTMHIFEEKALRHHGGLLLSQGFITLDIESSDHLWTLWLSLTIHDILLGSSEYGKNSLKYSTVFPASQQLQPNSRFFCKLFISFSLLCRWLRKIFIAFWKCKMAECRGARPRVSIVCAIARRDSEGTQLLIVLKIRSAVSSSSAFR